MKEFFGFNVNLVFILIFDDYLGFFVIGVKGIDKEVKKY